MKYNLGLYDIIIRWTIMLLVGIIGGLTHQTWLMVLVVPLFLTGVLAWDPIYWLMGKSTYEAGDETDH